MSTSFLAAVARVRAGEQTAGEAADALLVDASDTELLSLLDGDARVRQMMRLPAMIKAGPIAAGVIPRIGFPGVQFSDGPRGVVMGHSTAFPVTMMRGATWDPDLEREVGLAMGLEARAQGANYSGAVCINLLRHPAWGRAQECYGEDPVLTGRLGVALTEGLQRNVMACVKHFALNSMENARFTVDVIADEHALHEVYLPHFKAVVDGGVDSVMSAYNSVNGAFAGENRVLLTDILREEWGFEGFVTSDWVFGTHDALASLEAGMDIEMPLRLLRARELPAALSEGRVSRALVRESARRIVSTTVKRYAARDLGEPTLGVVAGADHRVLARRVAVRGAVLLKNELVDGDAVLPLPSAVTKLAVIGPLADEPNTGDHGSSLVHPPSTCSPLVGLQEALPNVTIAHHDGKDVAAAVAAARGADAVIVVVGMGFEDEGERVQNDQSSGMDVLGFPYTLLSSRPVTWLFKKLGPLLSQFGRGGDRESLTLHAPDEKLISAVASANPRTAVVVIGGSAITMEAWRHEVPAILMAWYPGMEGGRALADLLTGKEEPGGRLPLTIPIAAEHLPFFDAEAKRITYDSWWGQRLLDRDGHPAAFPFGFGLGYTTFDMSLLEHSASDVDGVATVRVTNTGQRRGSTVVQVYAADAAAPRPVPQLIGFQRVELEGWAETTVVVKLDLTPTRLRDPETQTWSARPGTWEVVVAPHSPTTLAGAAPLRPGSSG